MLDVAIAVALTTEMNTVSGADVLYTESRSPETVSAAPPFVVWSDRVGDVAEFSPNQMEQGRKYTVCLNGEFYVVEKMPEGDLKIFGVMELTSGAA